MSGTRKVALIGGGGLRTPLLIYGLAQARAAIGVTEVSLYDIDARRATMMAKLGQAIASESGIRITAPSRIEEAVQGAAFVLSSVRVGGMAARAQDERIAMEHGF